MQTLTLRRVRVTRSATAVLCEGVGVFYRAVREVNYVLRDVAYVQTCCRRQWKARGRLTATQPPPTTITLSTITRRTTKRTCGEPAKTTAAGDTRKSAAGKYGETIRLLLRKHEIVIIIIIIIIIIVIFNGGIISSDGVSNPGDSRFKSHL